MYSHDWIKFFVSILVAGTTTYGAIRADLATIQADLKSTNQRLERVENKVYK